MVFPRAHRYLTVFGDGWNQSEIWQIGMRLDSPPTAQPDQAQFDALKTAASNWFAAPNMAFTNKVRLLGVKVAPVGVDGLYGDGNDAMESLLATPQAGTSAVVQLVPQMSLAVTLTTNISRGRGSKGRYYPPPQSLNVGNDGRVDAGVAASIITFHKDFIDAINDVGLGPVSVGSALPPGKLTHVNGIRLGRVVDTQRRRRNQITEEYLQAAIPPL